MRSRSPLTRALVIALVLVCQAFAVRPVERSNTKTFLLSGDSTVQLGPKWPIAEFNEKGLLIRVDDPSTTGSDSCGMNLFLFGWVRKRTGVDSCRLAFQAIPLVLHTGYKTLANGQATTVDTSIVIDDAATSAAMDGNMDMVQISPICCVDSLQVRILPNAMTKKAASLSIEVGLCQINPHAQNN